MYVNIIFTNQSKQDCTLEGYPVVTFFNSQGQPMSHERQVDVTWVPSKKVVLRPEGIVGFVLAFVEQTVPSNGCRPSTQMEVELPHVLQFANLYAAYFTMPPAPCDGGGFDVTAIQEGVPTP